MSKKLVLESVQIPEWECWLVRVKEQTHRCHEFGDNNNDEFWHDGFRLVSAGYPEAPKENESFGHNTFYVQGDEKQFDRMPCCISFHRSQYYHRLIEAVKAYNRYFSGDNEEPEPPAAIKFTVDVIK